jgi:hypothetical protein
MTLRIALFLVVVTMSLAGCVATTVVQSVDGKAYVAQGSIFGTKMLNCDAADGNPECWPVEERNREQ